VKNICLTILFFILALSQNGRAQKLEPAAGKVRTLHFPADRSMGVVHVGELRALDPLWFTGWKTTGQAEGDVRVPINKAVMLDITTEAAKDISPLAGLGPDDIQVISFRYCGRNIYDSDLKNLSGLTGLKILGLDSMRINGSGLAHLSGLKSLEALVLARTDVSDDNLKHVAKLTSLKRLDLSGTKVTDAGLADLQNLSSLEAVYLGRTAISGEGFSALADTNSIRTLWLNYSKITDEGLRHIAKLKSLERLFLNTTRISDAGLMHISELKSLKELNLNNFGLKMKVSDAGLNYIAKLTSLEKLDLPDGITDAGLAKLKGLTGLKRLDIGRTKMTGAGLDFLEGLKSLEYLQLPQGGITDEDLAVVKELGSLQDLWIQKCSITNKGLSYLSELKSLKKLLLHCEQTDPNVAITSSGLAHLRGLPLTSLTLHNVKLDDSRLTHLAAFTQLEELEFNQMPLRDEDLANLSGLKNLKLLRFDSQTVSDGGLAYLTDLTSLERLSCYVRMTDKGLSYISNMTNLLDLQVGGDITDEGLFHLEGLKSLQALTITSRDNIASESLERLKKKLPLLWLKVYKTREIKRRPETGEVAPPFSLQTLDGKKLKLRDYRGKCVLLYFWATWCKGCVASTPNVKRFYEELSKHEDVVMISLAIDEDESGVRRYVERNKLTWPQVRLGLGSQIEADYGIIGVPIFILIGPDGRILLSREHDWNKFKAAVDKALSK
jgi:peroxiredoxin/Leucine-rich repeat (LRR) protein